MRVEITLTGDEIAKAVGVYCASRTPGGDEEVTVTLEVHERTAGPTEHPAGHSVTARVSWEEP